MADEKRIVIEITGNGGSNDGSGLTSRISTPSESSGNFDSIGLGQSWEMAGGNLEAANMAQALKISGTVGALSSMVVATVGSQALRQAELYFNLTENYKAQTDVANLKSLGNHVGGIAGRIGAGALAGSTFGPVGAAIGAGVGLGTAIISAFYEGRNKQFEQNLDIACKGYSVEYNRNLAGLISGDNRNTEG